MNIRFNRGLCAAVAAVALAGALGGCAPVVLGGAAVGGMMALDRRTVGTQVEDEGIELRIGNRVHGAYGDKVHVNVTSYNRQVLLTGEVPSAEVRDAVEKIAAGAENVRSVVNDLAAMPTTSLGQRSNDTYITGKVRASLVDARDLSANSFKVVTERNVVYLMGRVSQREAGRATAIARNISGVTKVVRVFEYLNDEEIARINAGQAAKPAEVTNGEVTPAVTKPVQ